MYSISLVPRPPASGVVWEVSRFSVIYLGGIANQIAGMHMSRKCHMLYAQPHLTSRYGYVTELRKRQQGWSFFCCI